MVTLKNIGLIRWLLLMTCLMSCSSSPENQIEGKYASQSENNYDHFKDTIEVRPTDDGKFDIQRLSNWSAAKKDDPQRPSKNKKAGFWINYGPGRIDVATFQKSDHTLRITEPMSSSVRIMKVDLEKQTIKWPTKYGDTIIYNKIN